MSLVSIPEAREILGDLAADKTDLEIARILVALELIAGWSVDKAEERARKRPRLVRSA